MTFDEWETLYNESRPEEPCCSDESPEQWSKIAMYAEGKLKEAYCAGAEHKAEEIAENLNGTTSFENYKRLRELEEKERWHYPNKGELPGKGQRILFLLKEPYFDERLFLGSRFQFDDDFFIWQCCGEEHWTDDMVFAWRYSPELPYLSEKRGR